MLHILLAETALEFIPKPWSKKPAVLRNRDKFGNAAALLDTSLHHTLMQNLPNAQKRGRPDILHHFLLDTLGSPANQQGLLRIYFHCEVGVFSVDSAMQCPRDYLRFKGLMVQLLKDSHVPPAPPFFIERIPSSLTDWISSRFNPECIFAFSSQGSNLPLVPLFRKLSASDQEILVIVGGFQKGAFQTPFSLSPNHLLSMGSQGLDSWVVVNRILTLYEIAAGILL